MPSPTAVPLPRALNTIPADVLLLIGSHTDERTIWAMRAVCRGWRDPADGALQPYLREKKVTVDPSLMIDSYKAIDVLPPKQYAARRKELLARHSKFARHVEAYPASSSKLERLTVEIRDDDSDAGWRIMEEFASQLRHLEIHIFDRFFTPVDWDKQQAVDKERLQIDKYNKRSWTMLVDSDSSPPNQLPLLTSLTIHSTARTINHFAFISPYVSNVRTLTLGQHWAGEHWEDNCYDMEELLTGPAFLQLERLSVTGSTTWTDSILVDFVARGCGDGYDGGVHPHDLLSRSPNLRSLVIHWLSNPRGSLVEWDDCSVELDEIIEDLVKPRWKPKRLLHRQRSEKSREGYGAQEGPNREGSQDPEKRVGDEGGAEEHKVSNDREFRGDEDGIPIRSLAIFGAHAEPVLRTMVIARTSYPHAFSNLTDLVLEVGDASVEDTRPMRVKDMWSPGHTHIDEDEKGERIFGLSALERICWVYRGRQRGSDGGAEGVMPAGYDEAGFRELLDRYPSLQQASVISEYPADPFAPIDPSDPNVICSVRRGDSAAL